MAIQTASLKGQVTIPVSIRKKLGIEAGTPIRFVERDGLVLLEKVDVSLASLCAIVSARKSASLNDMDRAVSEAVVQRFGRADAKR
jgi:antitoxin PrlF